MSELPLQNLPLEWIRAFEAAGRTGSFTAAARETGLTQAAISQRITNLEKLVGSRLFVRQARGVALTVDGEAWLPYVSGSLLALRQSCEDLFGVQRSKIVISASASAIELWFAQRLHDLSPDLCPQITFSTMVLQSEGEQQDATIKVRYGAGDWPEHYGAPLFREALCPVVSPGLLEAGGDWRGLPRIAVAGPRAGWQEWVQHSGDPSTPVPRLRFDSFAAALAAAGSGAGVLLASLPLCVRELEAGTLVRVSDDVLEPAETYWMIARRDGISKRQWDALAEHFCA